MKLSWVKALGGFFLAALFSAPAFGANPALPGTLNYVEGQASIENQPVSPKSVGEADLQAGQTLSTANGRAEVLLTPGVFLRLGHNSAVTMVSPDLTNTTVRLDKGRAEVEVAEIHEQNDLEVQQDGASTRMLKKGLYGFSTVDHQVRVFKGEARVRDRDKKIKVKAGHELTLDAPKLKTAKFDKNAAENGLYKWSTLRDEYLSDASANAARIYTGDTWAGAGWYWDPYYYDYTFIPSTGVLYSPFGPWGFYSPNFIYSYGPYIGYSPYLGYGYYGAPIYQQYPHGPSGERLYSRGLTHAQMPHPTAHTIPHIPPRVSSGFRPPRAAAPAMPHAAPAPAFHGGMGSFRGGVVRR
jgi:hypothetical protein